MQDQSPREIDEQLAEAEYAWMGIELTASRLRKSLASIEAGEARAYTVSRKEDYERELAEAEALQAPHRAIIDAANDEFSRRGGWRRYFLVVNSNGHVHRERSCSTCFWSTQYAWLPALSGCDEAEMVAEYGSDACSVCFPNAPALPGFSSSRTSREKAARKAEREAKRAAKAAKDAAKLITNADGSQLQGLNREVRTAREAKSEATDLAWDLEQSDSYFAARREGLQADCLAAFARITEALAAKLGTSAEEEAQAARKRAKRSR